MKKTNDSMRFLRVLWLWILGMCLLPVWAQAQTADLKITKAGPVSAYGGDNFTYTLTMNNNGPNSADGATFVDTLPAGLTNVGATCAASNGAACPGSLTVSNTSVSGSIPILPDLGKVVVTITGRFPISGLSSLTNKATITPPTGITDPDTSSNTSVVNTAMSYVVDLEVNKTQSTNTFTPGVPITYTMTLKNNGPAAADGANIWDDLYLDQGNAFVNFSAVFGGCTASGGAVCPANSNFPSSSSAGYVNLFSTNVPQLPSGGALTVIYTVTPTIVAAQTCNSGKPNISNNFSVRVPSGVTDSGNGYYSVNIPTTTAPPCPDADLEVSKTQSSDIFTPGVPVTYVMTLTNHGPGAADGASINDDTYLGTGDYIKLSSTFVSCTAAGGAVCPVNTQFQSGSGNGYVHNFDTTVPTVPAGGTLTIVYTMTPTVVGTQTCDSGASNIYNTFNANPPSGINDPGPGQNWDTVVITTPNAPACPQADLSVTKTQSSSVYTPGATVTYTMKVTNNGPSAANGATLDDAIYAEDFNGYLNLNMTFTGCTAAGGAACPANSNFLNGSGNYVQLTDYDTAIPTLPAGGSITFTYTMTTSVTDDVSCGAENYNIYNSINVRTPSGITDPNPWVNNKAETRIPITCYDISANKKVVGSDTTTSGSAVTYTVDVTNAGPGDATNVSFSDPLPSGFVYSSATCAPAMGSSVCGTTNYDSASRTVSSIITSIPANASVRFTITGVAGNTPGTYANTATIAPPATGAIDPISASNRSTVNLQIFNTRSAVTVNKAVVGAPAGGLPAPLTFTGTITCGPQPMQNWSVTVPAGSVSANSAALNFYDGDSCTTLEAAPPAPPAGYVWMGSPAISPNPTGILGPSTPVTVSVTNTLQRQSGALTLTKTIAGPTSATALVSGNFDFAINCGADGSYTASIPITAGGSASTTLNNLPAAAICTVQETASPVAPTGYTWGGPTLSGNPITIPAGSAATVGITNSLVAIPGSITIIKNVSGGPVGGVTGTFTFVVACSPSNTAIANPSVTLTGTTTGSTTLAGIPAGDSCTITEQAPPAPPADYSWGAAPAPVITAAMTAGGTQTAAFTNPLTANPGTLTITKTVTGGPSAGVSGNFVFA
ncbi:DUF5979 domain-containing protein, partial [Comamonas odontotermitis]|uniref:DUF5979 domain-containing protein n=1 Tax=Comamonas odontotermitis TaxID=379895 RepID=UPI00366A71A1